MPNRLEGLSVLYNMLTIVFGGLMHFTTSRAIGYVCFTLSSVTYSLGLYYMYLCTQEEIVSSVSERKLYQVSSLSFNEMRKHMRSSLSLAFAMHISFPILYVASWQGLVSDDTTIMYWYVLDILSKGWWLPTPTCNTTSHWRP